MEQNRVDEDTVLCMQKTVAPCLALPKVGFGRGEACVQFCDVLDHRLKMLTSNTRLVVEFWCTRNLVALVMVAASPLVQWSLLFVFEHTLLPPVTVSDQTQAVDIINR